MGTKSDVLVAFKDRGVPTQNAAVDAAIIMQVVDHLAKASNSLDDVAGSEKVQDLVDAAWIAARRMLRRRYGVKGRES
jgi:hypothetical protein